MKHFSFYYQIHLKLILLLFLAGINLSCSQNETGITSPNGKIHLSVKLIDEGNAGFGKVSFNVEYKDKDGLKKVLSDAGLGMETTTQSFTDSLKLLSVSDVKLIEDNYEMVTGKRSHCMNKGNERIYRFENKQGHSFEVTFRVYDDGVAFRYNLQATQENDSITNESTAYLIPAGTKRWIQQYSKGGGYEDFYPLKTSGEQGKENLWSFPLLLQPQDSVFMMITEANVIRSHSGARLYNGDDLNRYQVQLIDKTLAFNGTYTSPWRVLIIGSLADVVESTLVTDVSEPSTVSNMSWIVPGSSAWIYWAHNRGSKDFQIVKEYIDLAVDMNWSYDLIDAEWDVMENGGNIEDAIKYALEKNIKPMIWYNSSTAWMGMTPLYRLNDREKRLKEYEWLQEMGVVGIKIDFFSEENASMVNYYIDLLEDAEKYKLMINFHGATIPRGWQRTYPHLMTYEAVYGAEWYNNKPVLTDRAAEHNATLPFTRNVIGSMDYTPGTFSDSQHRHITSHGHELALPVVFESALQHMPDRPSTYKELPSDVRQLLSELPAAWDDTKLLGGYPGVDVILARRKADVWYIGGLNGTNENKTLTLSLNSLPVEGKTLTLFKDGEDDKSFAIEKDIQLSAANTIIDVPCLPRGGFVAVIK